MTPKSPEHVSCHYVKGVIAVPASQTTAASKLLGSEPLSGSAINRLMGGKTSGGAIEAITASVAVFRVSGDPHSAASGLSEAGVDASPVHGLGTMSHIGMMPGTIPAPATVKTDPVIPASSPGKVVCVVDSGISTSTPNWMERVLYDPVDVETVSKRGEASHGTFVAGLIRRIAAEHTVSVVRARTVPIASLAPAHGKGAQAGADPTTELHVIEAVWRLIERHRGDGCAVEALNLSLGATCDAGHGSFVSLAQAIDLWRNAFPDADVFAAGGNSPSASPVYPGAFGHVRSVAAAAPGGRQVVWDTAGNVVSPPPRYWIDEVAPGSLLVSPSGRTRREWVTWSGSSFATAVATACHVSRRPFEAQGGLAYWPDQAVNYRDIPGLLV